MASLEAVRAAPALYGNGSRKDRLWQAIDRQNSNQLYRAQRIAPDIIAAVARSRARTAIADAFRAALAERGRR
jgi:hypothetical protein